ncbi:MAG: O-antigen ligase family protein [Planctomycetota bacterium]|jgi:O-antigen ligase
MIEATWISSRWRLLESVLIWLLLCTPLVLDPWANLVSQYKGYYINSFACLILFVFLLRPLFRCGFAFVPSWIDLAFVLFFVYAGLSILWCVNTPVLLQRYCFIASAGVAFYLIRIRLAEGDNPWTYIRVIIAVATLVAIIDSITIWYSYYYVLPGSAAIGFKVGSSLFSHHNVASLYAVGVIPLAYCGLLNAKGAWRKGLYAFALLVILGYLYVLRSRAAWLEALLALIVITAGVRFRDKLVPFFSSLARILTRRWMIVLLAFLMLAATLLPMSDDFSAFAKANFMKAVNALELDYQRHFFRIDLWRKTMNMVSDHPWLGVGLGNFPVIFPIYHKLEQPKSHPHNEYFNVLVELGIVGMVLYGLLLVLLLRAFVQGFLDEDRNRFLITLGLGCALMVEGMHGMVEPSSVFVTSGLNLWVYSGLLVAMQARAVKAPVREVGPGGAVRRVVLPLMALAGLAWIGPKLGLTFTQGRTLKLGHLAYANEKFGEAERLYRKLASRAWANHYTYLVLGDICLRQRKNEEALEFYEKAEALFPHFYRIHCKKGVALREMGKPTLALEALNRCLEYNPGFSVATTEVIRTRFHLGDYKEAFRLLRNYLRSRKPTVEDLKLAGWLHWRAFEKLEEDSERLSHLRLSIHYYEQCLKAGGRVEKHIQHLRSLLPSGKASGER